jgi:D-glycero-D-manno-heptose 1,7-bisphosphate phosphatase
MVSVATETCGPRATVFLDRDGVLVIPEFRDGRSYAPTTLETFRLYSSAERQLGRLKEAGYLLVVVTNQPDVGRGVIAPSVLEAMHRRLATELPIDLIRACVHDGKEGCACRKPKPGMLLAAAELLNIDLGASFMVGDRASDIEAGCIAGCRTVFIDLGYNETKPSRCTFLVRSLDQAVDAVLNSADREG